MKKRILSLLVCGALATGAAASLAGCGGDDGAVKLTVWGPQAQQATLTAMVQEFKAANPDKNYDIRVNVVGEDALVEKVRRDVTVAADVYSFANDQLVPLLNIGGLARLGGDNLTAVQTNNIPASVEAATFGENVYGYPYAADNTYFMYYNKSVITDESDLNTLEAIIATCNEKDKEIGWALNTPWYAAGWFFTFGCTYGAEFGDDHIATEVTCDFNNENGALASKAMEMLAASGVLHPGTDTDDTTIKDGFRSGKMAVAVSGTWNAKDIKNALGENYGVCKLPTVTVDGRTENIKSFLGYKLYGVNPTSKNRVEAHRLAAFFSGERMQEKRFDDNNTGPTNITVAAMEKIINDPTLAVVRAQTPNTVPQKSVPAAFWDPLMGFGTNVIQGKIKDSNRQSQLDNLVEKILGAV